MDIYVIKKMHQNWNCGIQVIYGCSLYNSFNISACLKIFIIRYDKASIFLRVHQSELEAKDSFKELSKFICWLQFSSSHVSSAFKETISIHEVSLWWSLSDSCKLHAYVWILIKVSFFLQTVRTIKASDFSNHYISILPSMETDTVC